MAKSVAEILREAAQALEAAQAQQGGHDGGAPTAAPAPGSSRQQSAATSGTTGGTRAEVLRLFRPYKRPSGTPGPVPGKKRSYTHRFFCLADHRQDSVPTPGDKFQLEKASLGEKRIIFPDKFCTAEQFTDIILLSFPALRDCGGFQLLRSRGSTRSRILDLIDIPSDGYTPLFLDQSANIGQALIYIRPLQKDIDIKSLAERSDVSSYMVACMICGRKYSFRDIQDHVDDCQTGQSEIRTTTHSPSTSSESQHMNILPSTSSQSPLSTAPSTSSQPSMSCLPCTSSQSTAPSTSSQPSMSCLPCTSSQSTLSTAPSTSSQPSMSCLPCTSSQSTLSTAPSTSSQPSMSCLPSTSSQHPMSMAETTEDWKSENNLMVAAEKFIRGLLKDSATKEKLVVSVSLTLEDEDLERELISFYKQPCIDWTRPLQVHLRGDSAIGEGVKRHFFALVMEKVQRGLTLDLDNSGGRCLFFNGEDDHLVPSTAVPLIEGDLFRVVGRIIGHSFLNGGPKLCGLSEATFTRLCGNKNDIPQVDIQDCPDTDIVEVVSLLANQKDLSEDEKRQINTLAISWDLPLVCQQNRWWLAQQILFHGVIGRREKQLFQLRNGLKDTGVLKMIKERPEMCSVLFHRTAQQVLEPQMILSRIVWPVHLDSDSDSDGETLTIEEICQATSHLRHYIESGTDMILKELLRFWTGWTVPPEKLFVEVVSDLQFPVASTCLNVLKLPTCIEGFEKFTEKLQVSLNSTKFGFGRV